MQQNHATIENNVRQQLSSLYEMADYMGWSQLMFNHMSARTAPGDDSFFINPFGYLYDEVNASNLIKADFSGNILESAPGTEPNKAGFVIHSGIYRARPDINCVIHTHSHYGTAISNLEGGLEFLNQMAMVLFGKVGYHEFHGCECDIAEQEKLIESFGNNQCVILRNHGVITTGHSVAQAFFNHYMLEEACEVQLMSLSAAGGYKNIHKVQDSVKQYVVSQFDEMEKIGLNLHSESEPMSDTLFKAMERKMARLKKSA